MTVRRLIVRSPNWLGDAVMALPAMTAVRAAHRDAELIVAAPAGPADLFRERTDVAPDAVLDVERAQELEQLRDAKADAILLFPNSFGSAWTARRASIPERWGYATYGRSPLLTRTTPRPRGRLHQVAYYLALVRGLGFAAAATTPRITPSAVSVDRAAAALEQAGVTAEERLIGFAPGAAYGTAKRWPPDRVARVVTEIARRGFVPVLVGATADRGTGREIESALPQGTRLVNLIGRTSLRQLVGVAARCAAFVSNDSGAMHIAAALGVPLTAIFGPTDERVTSPAGAGRIDVLLRPVFCRPCMLRECPIDHRCMRRVGVEEVIASVGELVNW
jgi:heptosyltransferase-2